MSEPILYQSWDTKLAGPGKQFEYFADGICNIFSELYPELNEPEKTFNAKLSHCEVDQTAITRVHSTGYVVRHLSSSAKESDDCNFYLNHIISGQTVASQCSETIRGSSSNFYILDNSRPFELDISRNKLFRTQIIRLPRSPVLEKYEDCLFDLEQKFCDHRLMPLFKLNLAQLAQTDISAGSHEISYFGRTIASLVELMLIDQSESGLTGTNSVQVELILAEIERNLPEPDFTLEALALNLGLSSRQIQKVLAQSGLGFSDYLLDKRLALASTMLMQRPHKRSIEQIAYTCGFCHLSTFYRGFHRKYGMKPGDLRVYSGRQ